MGNGQDDSEMLSGLLSSEVPQGTPANGAQAQQIAASRKRWLIAMVVVVTFVAVALAWYVLSAPGMPFAPGELPIQVPTPTLGIPPTATPVP